MGMWKLKRRDFLKGVGLTGTGVILSGNAWSLNRLEPVGDTLATEYHTELGKTFTVTSGLGIK